MCLLFLCVINLSRCGLYSDAGSELGFLLLTGDELGHRLGAFQIVCWMMDLICAELTCASNVGQLDARFLPYHCELREYVRLAVHVMRVC